MGRRFGQHFLVRQSALARIAEEACPEPGEIVVEIGPGRGALTAHLLERAARVVAIEIDPVLVDYLRGKFQHEPRIEIVAADVLKCDLAAWGPAAVAGNLPYYITSPIVEKTLALGDGLRRAVFLVQLEVAQRLTAGPGSRDYGFLSVQAQLQAEVSMLFPVPRDAFRPPPKVDSAVVRMVPRVKALNPHDAAAFLEFASLCFRHKRKTLRNNLLDAYPNEALEAMPESGRRAEQLSIDELVGLWRSLGGAPNQAN